MKFPFPSILAAAFGGSRREQDPDPSMRIPTGPDAEWRRPEPLTPDMLDTTVHMEALVTDDQISSNPPDLTTTDSVERNYRFDESGMAAGPADPASARPDQSSSRIMYEAKDKPHERERCPVCRGTGFKMTTSDLLRESIGLIEGREDAVVRMFYENLLNYAPHLVPLFPADLLDPDATGRGKGQRDKLVAALSALATEYDLNDPARMKRLDTILDANGRHHSAFTRPDGSVSRASIGEYSAVVVVFIATAEAVGGEKWLPVYTVAWTEALEYASARMLMSSIRNPQKFARTVRS